MPWKIYVLPGDLLFYESIAFWKTSLFSANAYLCVFCRTANDPSNSSSPRAGQALMFSIPKCIHFRLHPNFCSTPPFESGASSNIPASPQQSAGKGRHIAIEASFDL